MADSELVATRDGGVMEIAFNRPQKKNALTAGMYLAAAQADHRDGLLARSRRSQRLARRDVEPERRTA